MIPVVAIVGRPNVGKSTLFNRLVGRRKAIVQDDPGVTRDRHYGAMRLEGRRLLLVDTGGFEPDRDSGIEALIAAQTELAIEEADLVLAVFDAREGLLPSDRAVIERLRRTGKPVLHVANKVDGPRQSALSVEFYALGAARVLDVSAEHGLGLEELADAILESIPLPAPDQSPASVAVPAAPRAPDEAVAATGTGDDREIRLALVGRPNAGKSSLLNFLVGQPRSIVSEVPGTTRDPVDVRLETPKGPLVIVDTAGIRRRRSVSSAMEKFAIVRALRSVEDADVVCLLMDSEQGVAEQDAKITGLVLEAGRGLVLTFSKSDLLCSPAAARRDLAEQVRDRLQFVPFAPLTFFSTVSGQGVGRLLATVRRVHASCGQRVSTAELNRFLEEATAAHPAPSFRGHALRFYYATQPQVRPPTFLVTVNYSNGVHLSYRRYLVNQLRQRFGFEGAPIRLFFRRRQRDSSPGARRAERGRRGPRRGAR